jgi:hypothetical protein
MRGCLPLHETGRLVGWAGSGDCQLGCQLGWDSAARPSRACFILTPLTPPANPSSPPHRHLFCPFTAAVRCRRGLVPAAPPARPPPPRPPPFLHASSSLSHPIPPALFSLTNLPSSLLPSQELYGAFAASSQLSAVSIYAADEGSALELPTCICRLCEQKVRLCRMAYCFRGGLAPPTACPHPPHVPFSASFSSG